MSARVFSILHTVKPKDVSHAAWLVLIHLEERYSYEKHCAYVKKAWLAEKMNVSERYIQTLLNELEKAGLLRVYTRSHRHNRYVVPRLVGEVLPADIEIPEGPFLLDPETQEEWKLREPYEATPETALTPQMRKQLRLIKEDNAKIEAARQRKRNRSAGVKKTGPRMATRKFTRPPKPKVVEG